MDGQGGGDQGPRQSARSPARTWLVGDDVAAELGSLAPCWRLSLALSGSTSSQPGSAVHGGDTAVVGQSAVAVDEPGPEGGRMDTSRGSDGPIDSRADRQLRPSQGRHIMMWRQTWRQNGGRGGDPHDHHHQPIIMPATAKTTCGPRLLMNPASTVGDHSDRNSVSGPPCDRLHAWATTRQRGQQPAQRLQERSFSEVVCRPQSRLAGRRSSMAWQPGQDPMAQGPWRSSRGGGARPLGGLEHQAGAAPGHRHRTDRGLETAPDAQPRPTPASQYRQYSRIPHAPHGHTSHSRDGFLT